MVEMFNNNPLGGKFLFIGFGFAILAILFLILYGVFAKKHPGVAKVSRGCGILAIILFAVFVGGGILLLQFHDDGGNNEVPAVIDTSVTFEDIYRDTEANDLVAGEKYVGNRYRVTARINGIESGGVANLSGGATLTMETEVDGIIVFFFAEFEEEQEEALKQVVVGDTITFEGEWRGSSFSDCIIVIT